MTKIKIGLLLTVIFSIITSNIYAKKQPNIIFILADDYGYMDTQAYAKQMLGVDKSETYYETPNIDRLVDEGIAFEQAYANQLCSPTRASLLTGKYAARLGFTTATPRRETYYNTNKPVPQGSYAHDVLDHHDPIKIEMALINGSSNTALPAGAVPDKGWDETTIAEALPDYHSAFIGKWHVGGHGAEGYTPNDQGFDAIAWHDAGASRYYKWRPIWNNREKGNLINIPQKELLLGDAGDATGFDYLTEDLTEQAVRYIQKQAKEGDKPFFLYFCHFAVHGPYQGVEKDIEYFENKKTKGWNHHKDPIYASMIRGLDNSVGRILTTLEETGLEDNTMVVFMSDNGGIDYRVTPNQKVTSNYPLNGGKACVTEGGIRVPLVFRWKGQIEAGKWSNVPVDCSDIFPTLVEAAGYNVKPYYKGENKIDGESLMALIDDVDNKKHSYHKNTMYWHYPFNVIYNNPYDGLNLTPHSAIRQGDYKLIFDWHGRLQLFNIKEDISEQHNLAKANPALCNDLFDQLITWLDANVKLTYWPTINTNYNPENDLHMDKFIDLMKIYRAGGDVAAAAH